MKWLVEVYSIMVMAELSWWHGKSRTNQRLPLVNQFSSDSFSYLSFSLPIPHFIISFKHSFFQLHFTLQFNFNFNFIFSNMLCVNTSFISFSPRNPTCVFSSKSRTSISCTLPGIVIIILFFRVFLFSGLVQFHSFIVLLL